MFSCVNFEARAKIQRLSMWVVMVRERLEIENFHHITNGSIELLPHKREN
jgi:hypothetical protein